MKKNDTTEEKRAELLSKFDPNAIGVKNAGIFGLPFTPEESDIIIVPVPWDLTVSSGSGTSENLDAIFEASLQVDLFDEFNQDAWKDGIALQHFPPLADGEIASVNKNWRPAAERYIKFLADGRQIKDDNQMERILEEINIRGIGINELIEKTTCQLMKKGKMVGLLGGDHSTSLGMIQALARMHPEGFSILHFDAHADLREAYEGFEYSHASIMFNALKIPQVEKIVQVGIRDYCEEENKRILSYSRGRVNTLTMRYINDMLFKGKSWYDVCCEVDVREKVYISFDIDVLDPSLCPHTGTPVPGGLSYHQATYLLEKFVRLGRQIIGFDLVEVGNHPWDANVAARLLYKLCSVMHASQKRNQ